MNRSQTAFVTSLITTVLLGLISVIVAVISGELLFRQRLETFASRLAQAKKNALKSKREKERAERRKKKISARA